MKRALAIALVTLAGCTSEAWDPMEEQPRPTPFKRTDLFTDGRVMRPVPEDTVSRDAPRDPDGVHAPLTLEGLERGHELFDVYCAACHGVRGNGESAVARKMSLRPPPSLVAEPVRSYQDAQLFKVVTDGYGLMPPLRTWLPADDRWKVVDYLRALQLSADVPADQLDDADRAQLRKGTP